MDFVEDMFTSSIFGDDLMCLLIGTKFCGVSSEASKSYSSCSKIHTVYNN